MPKSSIQLTREEYDVPVYYCKSCHSLHVLVDESMADQDWDGSYCGKCYSSNIGVCKMGEWLEEEERREKKRKELEWNK